MRVFLTEDKSKIEDACCGHRKTLRDEVTLVYVFATP